MAKLVYNKNLKRKKKVHFVPPLFIATNATHFPYYCICFFPLQKLWILQHNEHIFYNCLLAIFVVTCIFFSVVIVHLLLCVIFFKSMRIVSCVHVSSISWLGFLFDFLFFHGIFISFPFIFSILTMLLKLPWLTIFDNLNLSFNF